MRLRRIGVMVGALVLAFTLLALPAAAAVNYDNVWYNDNEHAPCWLESVHIYVSGTFDQIQIKGDTKVGGGYEYSYTSGDYGVVAWRTKTIDTNKWEMWDVQVRALSNDGTHTDAQIYISTVDLTCA